MCKKLTKRDYFRICKQRMDLTNDCSYGDFYSEEKSIWKRYFLYKNGKGAEDPDSRSLLAQKMYRLLWPGVETKDYMLLNDRYACDTYSGKPTEKLLCVSADTMNSATTTLGCFPNECGNSLKKQTQHYEAINRDDERFEEDLMCVLWPEFLDEGKKDYITDMFRNFLRAWHTIGNYLPTPRGFNVGRYKKTSDYWDLTLKAIYDWYDGKEEAIEELIICRPESQEKVVGNTRKWLSDFQIDGKPSWQAFVEENYMQPFVEVNKDGTYGMPKELWYGHFSSSVKPEQKDDLELFFNNATEWINERSDLIYRTLTSRDVAKAV